MSYCLSPEQIDRCIMTLDQEQLVARGVCPSCSGNLQEGRQLTEGGIKMQLCLCGHFWTTTE